MAGPEIVAARAAATPGGPGSGRFDVDAVRAIEHAAGVVHGHAVLGEAVWRDLADPQPDSAGFFARSPQGGHLGYVHVSRSDSFAAPHWSIGLVRQPRIGDETAALALLDTACRYVATHGGGRLVLWQFDPTPADDAIATGAGFRATRDLLQMRVELPLATTARWPEGISVRAFEPGRDDSAWLDVNNRAFRNHPEQGGWIEATLARRLAEPWFDPSLFLVAFDATGLVGFDWLKVHGATGDEPRIGEIFVIGVDPRAQGSGLGRSLAVAGLERLANRGIGTGMLFVAAENTGALALYRSLGFTVHRVDRAYEREVLTA